MSQRPTHWGQIEPMILHNPKARRRTIEELKQLLKDPTLSKEKREGIENSLRLYEQAERREPLERKLEDPTLSKEERERIWKILYPNDRILSEEERKRLLKNLKRKDNLHNTLETLSEPTVSTKKKSRSR